MVYYNPDINKFWVIDYRTFSPEHDGATKVEHLLNMLNNAVYSKKIQDPRYNQLGFRSSRHNRDGGEEISPWFMGWNTESIDGHDFEQINASLIKEQNSDKPYLIAG